MASQMADGDWVPMSCTCRAHPSHFAAVLEEGGRWRDQILGLRANASRTSQAELDEAENLDEGVPADLARRVQELSPRLPNLAVLGGCCGTDRRHMAAIARTTFPLLWEGLNPSLDTRLSRATTSHESGG